MSAVKAGDVPIGKEFSLKGSQTGARYRRVLFEHESTVIYRCVVNIAAIGEMDNILFLPVNSEVDREEVEWEEKAVEYCRKNLHSSAELSDVFEDENGDTRYIFWHSDCEIVGPIEVSKFKQLQ